ncbi:MAG TPA: CBS domain-containing protein [Actinopolymorphaceae bacterium]|jgi:CBS domain-containing protein
MTTAREIMHPGCSCIRRDNTLQEAARLMRDQNIGALPICDENDHLVGILTDRDIVVKCVAAGRDCGSVTAGELAEGPPHTIDADADVDQVLQTMEHHQVHRLPVLEQQRVVGIIAEADLARHLPEQKVGEFVRYVSADLTGP